MASRDLRNYRAGIPCVPVAQQAGQIGQRRKLQGGSAFWIKLRFPWGVAKTAVGGTGEIAR